MEKNEPKKSKHRPMSKDEIEVLLKLIKKYKIIISKATNAATNIMKERAWRAVCCEFNTYLGETRTTHQLKFKWDNLKKAARKRAAKEKANNSAAYFPSPIEDSAHSFAHNKREIVGSSIPPGRTTILSDEILDRVASIMDGPCCIHSTESEAHFPAPIEDSTQNFNKRETEGSSKHPRTPRIPISDEILDRVASIMDGRSCMKDSAESQAHFPSPMNDNAHKLEKRETVGLSKPPCLSKSDEMLNRVASLDAPPCIKQSPEPDDTMMILQEEVDDEELKEHPVSLEFLGVNTQDSPADELHRAQAEKELAIAAYFRAKTENVNLENIKLKYEIEKLKESLRNVSEPSKL